MADTSIKLSGTYDSIEAYNILEEMREMSTDYEEIKEEAEAAASAATAAVTTAQTAANNASTYATNAQTYAGNANTSAGEASGYASNASTSATNAATSEGNAATSATNAHNSELAAADSADDAEAAAELVKKDLPLPIGYEYFSFNPNIPQGSLPLFGGEYARATYSDLWAWVQTQTGYLKTEAEWQTLSASNNGNVPFYSSGDGSTTFRVPSLKCWIKGANGTVSEVGSYLAAGLPNIDGSYEIGVSGISKSSPVYGAFSHGSGTASLRASDTTQAATSYTNGMLFSASNSNAIYGNSNTVQPPSIVGMWLVKAYGVIVDTGQIDEQAYIDDRYNAMKQYVDDKIDTVSTYELSMNPVNPTGKAYFTKKGNMCMVYFDGILNLPSGGTTLPASIPESFRPITVTRTVHVDANNKRIMLSLGQNGDVYFYNYGPAITVLQPFYESLTYICAD